MSKRNLNLSASLEDYLEAIFFITKDKSQKARSKDIAEMLKVARPSVTAALQQLAEKNLINYKPYGTVTLTIAGKKEAAKIAEKHDVIKSFFVEVLGVEKNIAQEAACKAEHVFGPSIVNKIIDFKEFMQKMKERGDRIPEHFKEYCKQKKQQANKVV